MTCKDGPEPENCQSEDDAYASIGNSTIVINFYAYSKSVDLGKTENYEIKSMQWLDDYIIKKQSDIGTKSFILQTN